MGAIVARLKTVWKRRWGRLVWAEAVACVAFGLVVTASCSVAVEDRLEPQTEAVAVESPSSLPEATITVGNPAVVLVQTLTVAEEFAAAEYDRAAFPHWVDTDGNGCDTRCEVLARQRLASLPGLPNGGWLSIYDGYSTDDPSELDIDHVVALSEAWRSGAWEWDNNTRRAFANDLDSSALIAVTAATNRAKSDRDPASWQPSNDNAWCDYGIAWTTVKIRWGLTAQQAEVDALRNMLNGCTVGSIDVEAAVVIMTTTTTPPSPPPPPPPLIPVPDESSVYYKNCIAARAAGAAPIYRGELGYRPALDRDNDGIACQ